MLGVDGEARLLGHGVSTCATCDGFFFREKDIIVVGGGDSALEEAIFLSRFGRSVTVIHRRKELRASKIMQDRAFANERISFVWNSVVEEVLGDTSVDGCALRDTVTGETSDLAASTASSSRSGTSRTQRVFEGQLISTKPATSSPMTGPRPTSRVSSPAATSRTTSTARRSPPPARVAWRR